jgi:hypothetical protein
MCAPETAPSPVFEREVTATREEFLRGLRTAFPGAVAGGPERFRATYRGTVMDVELASLAPRVVGRLALPVLAVRIGFPAAGAEERAAMLAWLDLMTHRGGG